VLKLNQQLSRDLDSLFSTDVRFQRVVEEWFAASLQDYREAGDLLDGNNLYRNQGKCIILSDLVKAIRESRDTAERFST